MSEVLDFTGSDEKKQLSIEILPNECLFEIFRRLHYGQDRICCASVSKCWLMLLSNIHGDEILGNQVEENDEFLSRYLEGKKATDLRLAAISVGASSRGGLKKLSVRSSNVTNDGLKVISRGCPSLRVLSLYNVSSIGDEGLVEIAKGCKLLEKLYLSKCPRISNKGLLAIIKGCPNLTSLTLESCPNIGNETLQTISRSCQNLNSFSITKCALIGDQSIASLLSSPHCGLTKVKLQGLNVSDRSLAVLGHYGEKLTDLLLIGLQNVSEKGFWAMANGKGFPNIESLKIVSCYGVTDLVVIAMGKGCPNLKHLQLSGLNGITDDGIIPLIENISSGLTRVNLSRCVNLTDKSVSRITNVHGFTLEMLNLDGCRLITDESLVAITENCSLLSELDVSKCAITDSGIKLLACTGKLNLRVLSLSGCCLVSENSFPFLGKLGDTLEGLNIQKCHTISRKSVEDLAIELWMCDILF